MTKNVYDLVLRAWSLIQSNDLRSKRLRLAVGFSFASKAVRLVTQTMIVGLAIRYVGPERYGFWLTAVAGLGWVSWGQAGLTPGLVNAVAAAEAEGRAEDQQIFFTTALTLIAFVSASIYAVLVYVIFRSSLAGYLLPFSASHFESGSGSILKVALFLAVLRLPLGIVESVYIGLQRVHLLRAFDILGQLLALTSVAVLTTQEVAPDSFFLIAGLSSEAGAIFGFFYLIIKLRPNMFPKFSGFSLKRSKSMLGTSSAYLLVAIAGYLVAHAGTLMLAAYKGPARVPEFALVWQLYQMAAGLWMMFVTGIWGALVEASAREEWTWIQSVKTRLLLGSMTISLSFSVGLAAAGPLILAHWTGGEIMVNSEFSMLMAFYCLIYTWSDVHGQLLTALNFVWRRIVPALMQAILVVVLCKILIPLYGLNGLAFSLIGACLLTTCWAFPVILGRAVPKKTLEDAGGDYPRPVKAVEENRGYWA